MITLSRESFNNHTFKCEGDAFLGGDKKKRVLAKALVVYLKPRRSNPNALG
jgi:hypothetical protein